MNKKFLLALLGCSLGTSFASNLNNATSSVVLSPLVADVAQPSVVVQITQDGKLAYFSRNSRSVKPQILNIGGSKKFRSVIYGQDKFIAVGEGGLIAVSADGINWTEQAIKTQDNFRQISYDPTEKYTLYSDSGVIRKSPDGIIWRIVPNEAVPATQPQANKSNKTDGSGAYINIDSGISFLSNSLGNEWNNSLSVGYNFNRGLGVEAGYNLMSEMGSGTGLTTNIFDLAVKGNIPMGEIFSLYGKTGIAYSLTSWTNSCGNSTNFCVDKSPNSTMWLLAVGTSFNLNRWLALHVEDTVFVPFDSASSITGTINTLMGGLQIKF